MTKAGIGLALVLLGCSTTPQEAERAASARADVQAELDRELAGLTPGERQACFPLPGRQQTSSEVFGSTILYRAGRNLKIRNDTTGGCENARRGNDTLVTVSPSSRLCRGDIVRTVDRVSGFQTGSCALGDFVSYRRQR
jgi:hypothetical protein